MVPPPSVVVGPPWGEALGEVGFEFPADYRQFVDTYGAGSFEPMEYVGLEVVAPHVDALGPASHPRFAGFLAHHVNGVRPLFAGDEGGEAMWHDGPQPLYPEPGGLLAWGHTHESDQFFRRTQDANPDRWTVVGGSRHDGSTFVFDGGMVEFLLALFTGRVDYFGEWDAPGLTWEMQHDWLHRSE